MTIYLLFERDAYMDGTTELGWRLHRAYDNLKDAEESAARLRGGGHHTETKIANVSAIQVPR